MNWSTSLESLWQQKKFLCVGLDTDVEKIPLSAKEGRSLEDAILFFNRSIIDATHSYVCSYKLNSAFYEKEGEKGWHALKLSIAYIKETYPDIPVILDAKRADIGSTSEEYAQAVFDELAVDAVTVNPYLGKNALDPFLNRKDKGVIVLVKTSSLGSGEFQDLIVENSKEPLYMAVARQVSTSWNQNNNCGVVVGATYPESLSTVRSIIGKMPMLIPGIGAQGGNLQKVVEAAKDERGWGIIINASRSIIYASRESDFAQKAQENAQRIHNLINQYR